MVSENRIISRRGGSCARPYMKKTGNHKGCPYKRWLLLILVLTFLLRLPSLFEPHRYADEDIYFTLGMAMRRGLSFYRDIHDNKPPLIYILAGLTGSVFWLRFVLLIWHGFNVFLFYLLAYEIFLKKNPQKSLRAKRGSLMKQKKNFKVGSACYRFPRIPGMTRKNKRFLLVIFITVLFSFLTTIPTFEGNIANGEIFMIMPATAGAYLLWKNRKKTKDVQFFWAGILFAIAFLFKVPIMFDLTGIMLFLWLFKEESFKKRLKFLMQPAPWLTLFGFFLPIILITAYYALMGAFRPFFYSALFQNIGYLSSWQGGGSILQSDLFQKGVIVLAILSILFFIRKRLRIKVLFVCIWFVFSLFGALLSERPYPHYLIEVAVPFVLLVGLVLESNCHSGTQLFSKKGLGDRISYITNGALSVVLHWRTPSRMTKTKLIEEAFLIFMVCLVFVSFFYYKFWYYKSLPYYQNFIEFTLKKRSQVEYFDFFGSVTRNYQVAHFIKEGTNKNDKIFIWGTQPAIYVIAGRLPVGRYTVSYHIVDFNAWSETINNIKAEEPKFIVKMIDEPKNFTQLDSLLAAKYILVKTVEEAEIWKKVDGI